MKFVLNQTHQILQGGGYRLIRPQHHFSSVGLEKNFYFGYMLPYVAQICVQSFYNAVNDMITNGLCQLTSYLQ